MSTLKARKLRRKGAAPKWGDVLAPLLDVIFLLVIFLLVTASFDDRQLIDVQLPQARGDSTAGPQEKEDSGLILVLLKDGSIRWQDNVFTLEELTPLLAQLPEETRLNSFTIQADQEVSMEAGLQLLGELKLLGWSSANFEVSPPSRPAADLEPTDGEG